MENKMNLFHTGFSEIKSPDIRKGRKNADFGQGFYLSDNEEFSKRWARQRKGEVTFLNKYELCLEGLKIKHFVKNKEWFDYIFANRRSLADIYADYDVIIGPIANDTIYDTYGILTSGLIDEKKALEVLMIGATYEQIVIKSEKAAKALHFMSAEILKGEEIAKYREWVKTEVEKFQEEFSRIVGNLDELLD